MKLQLFNWQKRNAPSPSPPFAKDLQPFYGMIINIADKPRSSPRLPGILAAMSTTTTTAVISMAQIELF
jgi:hypothetical protein